MANGGKNDGIILGAALVLLGVFGPVPLSCGGACGTGKDGLNGN